MLRRSGGAPGCGTAAAPVLHDERILELLPGLLRGGVAGRLRGLVPCVALSSVVRGGNVRRPVAGAPEQTVDVPIHGQQQLLSWRRGAGSGTAGIRMTSARGGILAVVWVKCWSYAARGGGFGLSDLPAAPWCPHSIVCQFLPMCHKCWSTDCGGGEPAPVLCWRA